MLLKGKRGLILGIANDMSIAYGIAKLAAQEGAELLLTYQNDMLEKRVHSIADELQASCFPCDVIYGDQMDSLFQEIEKKWGNLDFLLHSIAYADRSCLKGKFFNISREKFLQSMEISCYSLIDLTKRAYSLMQNGGAILTLSYLGSEKIVPNYNVMGIAKAALESSVRYLAYDVGQKGIRVNALSAGPIRTRAAYAIADFRSLLAWNAKVAPLKRNIVLDDVAKAGVYLLSSWSSGITGEIHYVDCGSNIMAPIPVIDINESID